MFLRTILVIFSGGLLLCSCNSPAKKRESGGYLLVKGAAVQTSFGSCDSITNHGAEFMMDLWQPADSNLAARTIRDMINQKSIQRINFHSDSASISTNPMARKSVKGAFEVFEKNYNDFRKTAPDAPGCWQIELKGDTVMVTPKVLFYQLSHYAFTGGAHPNSFLACYAFDARTGGELPMKSFVSDSAALLKLVEKKFKEVEDVAPETDLESAGYFLTDHKFFLPANYIFTREGMQFYYNAYEIAAYVRGPIEFIIPYAELKGLIKIENVF